MFPSVTKTSKKVAKSRKISQQNSYVAIVIKVITQEIVYGIIAKNVRKMKQFQFTILS